MCLIPMMLPDRSHDRPQRPTPHMRRPYRMSYGMKRRRLHLDVEFATGLDLDTKKMNCSNGWTASAVLACG